MNLLSIGGSDPSSGAGIQSDIKTFEQVGSYGFTVVTAVTSQNSSGFGLVEPLSTKILKDQLNAIFSDFKIDGIKISMVYNTKIIKTIHNELKNKKIPIVVDPVIKSTTGGVLLEKTAVKDFIKFLVPLATVITPNKFEAEFLTKTKINSKKDMQNSARMILELGAKNVVITGIDEGKKITDWIFQKDEIFSESSPKLNIVNHGSGCNYSAALIFALASGKSLKESTVFAKKFTYNSINNAKKIGKGIAITEGKSQDKILSNLSEAISEFINIKNIHSHIPECQTNFVYSKKDPKSIKDVLGIEGRIVRTGKKVAIAGSLEYGGSKHVATAVVAMNEKFPDICSAINLKYEPKVISNIKKRKFKIADYDRSKEPSSVKGKGSTIEWGIKSAIKRLDMAPDVVFHKGDFGKEPMIIIFGTTPSQVLEKISKIIKTK
jgi:hydroxymethylpyrimidine kinase/phosphomethylpyrimidine kinase